MCNIHIIRYDDFKKISDNELNLTNIDERPHFVNLKTHLLRTFEQNGIKIKTVNFGQNPTFNTFRDELKLNINESYFVIIYTTMLHDRLNRKFMVDGIMTDSGLSHQLYLCQPIYQDEEKGFISFVVIGEKADIENIVKKYSETHGQRVDFFVKLDQNIISKSTNKDIISTNKSVEKTTLSIEEKLRICEADRDKLIALSKSKEQIGGCDEQKYIKYNKYKMRYLHLKSLLKK
jgi:hypothetical protein